MNLWDYIIIDQTKIIINDIDVMIDCFDFNGNKNCIFSSYNNYNIEMCIIDNIVQTRYYSCIPMKILKHEIFTITDKLLKL